MPPVAFAALLILGRLKSLTASRLLQAIDAAAKAGKPADTFYCLELLEETGILTVPGSGFGQKKGSFHLRTTILPPEDQMPTLVGRFQKFHAKFMDKYR